MAELDSNPRPPDDDSAIQGRNWLSALVEALLARLTPSCTRVLRTISESLDRPISAREWLQLRAHYVICCYCRRYDRQVHQIRRFTRALPEHLDEIMQMRLDEALKEQMKKRLRDEQ